VMIGPLPPKDSSDGHGEAVPERWTSRMPARYRCTPPTITLPDGADVLLGQGQARCPVPFLELKAGRTNEIRNTV
jgi:hypothetical protein